MKTQVPARAMKALSDAATAAKSSVLPENEMLM